MSDASISFTDLALSAPVLEAIQRIGYEQPSPIQAESIPHILNGEDLLGVAQTGTGKTAAFALPLLSVVDADNCKPQVLVLAPTRELAIQVAEAFQNYAKNIPGFRVLPIYGGQSMSTQLKQLQRGAHVVVGTPGRVMDHLRRGTLKLNHLKSVVLDEADEMLRMGFIDDVTWIMDQTPDTRQVALFSATMPNAIKKVADTYLKNPKEVRIATKTSTVERIEQKYWLVSGVNKLDGLTRILEVEDFDAVIMFVRTKTQTVELADKMEARGHSAAAINGDMTQKLREQTIAQLKKGTIDILVATDVAARGIDVPRISHVINYDIPYDNESYVHRIGRTGRAGREGKAILFVSPRERRLLRSIEKTTRQPIDQMELPSRAEVNKKRVEQFKQSITETIENKDLEFYLNTIKEYQAEHDADLEKVAGALAFIAQDGQSLLLQESPKSERKERGDRNADRPPRKERGPRRDKRDGPEAGMETFRLSVGRDHHVQPGDIVGAIANEVGMDSEYIGRIQLFDTYSTVDLPEGMPKEAMQHLQKVRVRGQALSIEKASGGGSGNKGKSKGKKFDDKKGPKKRRDNSSNSRGNSGDDSRGNRAPKKKKPKPKSNDANGNTTNSTNENRPVRKPRRKPKAD